MGEAKIVCACHFYERAVRCMMKYTIFHRYLNADIVRIVHTLNQVLESAQE